MEEGLPRKKSKESQGKGKSSFASESATKRPKKLSWTCMDIGSGGDILYSAANDPRPQMIPRPEMIPKLDRK